jgi:leucyl-tRNA synthetase
MKNKEFREAYDFRRIEEKWQEIWAREKVFEVCEDPRKVKYYCLEMYPYPSGYIHMGHVRNYSIGDVISRYWIKKGFNVIHPIGWDALGMPAENAAIQHGIHPQTWTMDNIAHMRRQMQRLGLSYDWSREVNTCLPEYYKWNQWIFLKMFERGLAFRKESWVNWCPDCLTVLANEQVTSGQCWRCDEVVIQKKMEQWFLKITAYADELLSGHELLKKWPEHVLLMQKNWIGKSRGSSVSFPVPGTDLAIEVFTTRIDTICGATFLVLSPEHPLAHELVSEPALRQKLHEWMSRAVGGSRLIHKEGVEEKEGIDTGRKAINPFTRQEIPIWIANYVLMEYGTGAIMGVPAHDQRDYEFARKYGIPIKSVIFPEAEDAPGPKPGEAYEAYGVLRDSGAYSGMRSVDAIEKMNRDAQERGFGRESTIFRLRDWGISRQRYWGTPIPIIYCQKCGTVGVPYKDLPVVIPFDVKFTGEEGSPLEKLESFVKTACPKCGGEARRETDTMDTFVDSSWYYFRYGSPHEDRLPFDPESADYWLPVDLYIGGVEHAILHLIYARFFTKALRDLGLTKIDEPFPHYLAQGMVTKDGAAMSKSKGNVVDPDEIVRNYGADALRLFILFASPPEKEFAWAEEGIEGCYRFLVRVWSLFQENRDLFEGPLPPPGPAAEGEGAGKLLKKIHQTIKKVSEDIEIRFHLNTAISAIMELYNQIKRDKDALRESASGRFLLRDALEKMTVLLSPFTPHICEEIWGQMGYRSLLALESWPSYVPELAREERVTVVVQVNGKLRDKFEIEQGAGDERLQEEALGLGHIRSILEGKRVRKVICIKDRLVNFVV